MWRARSDSTPSRSFYGPGPSQLEIARPQGREGGLGFKTNPVDSSRITQEVIQGAGIHPVVIPERSFSPRRSRSSIFQVAIGAEPAGVRLLLLLLCDCSRLLLWHGRRRRLLCLGRSHLPQDGTENPRGMSGVP